MLSPRRVKFRKTQKGKMKGVSHRGTQLAYGTFGIKSLDEAFITARQIEAARIAATIGTRMGKGKGAPEYWVAPVQPGRILFEVGGVPVEVASEALRLAAQKLPVKTKFIVARDFQN